MIIRVPILPKQFFEVDDMVCDSVSGAYLVGNTACNVTFADVLGLTKALLLAMKWFVIIGSWYEYV